MRMDRNSFGLEIFSRNLKYFLVLNCLFDMEYYYIYWLLLFYLNSISKSSLYSCQVHRNKDQNGFSSYLLYISAVLSLYNLNISAVLSLYNHNISAVQAGEGAGRPRHQPAVSAPPGGSRLLQSEGTEREQCRLLWDSGPQDSSYASSS